MGKLKPTWDSRPYDPGLYTIMWVEGTFNRVRVSDIKEQDLHTHPVCLGARYFGPIPRDDGRCTETTAISGFWLEPNQKKNKR